MVPRLEEKYALGIETVSKPRDAYRTAEYQATGLPVAPAVLLNDELLVQGEDGLLDHFHWCGDLFGSILPSQTIPLDRPAWAFTRICRPLGSFDVCGHLRS